LLSAARWPLIGSAHRVGPVARFRAVGRRSVGFRAAGRPAFGHRAALAVRLCASRRDWLALRAARLACSSRGAVGWLFRVARWLVFGLRGGPGSRVCLGQAPL